ncbi:MAG: hypothetical protein KJ630_03690 [Proteobacteria bacterium]|nr:hypothetical protein [Pseudomonadota bacterium]
MKAISVLAMFFTLLFFNLNAVFSQDLNANIMRKVNAANQELDKAEDQIKTGKLELAPAKVKSAQKEYDAIFSYYGGSFDPAHPVLVKLKNRIANITEQASGKSQKPQSGSAVSTGEKLQTEEKTPPGITVAQGKEQNDLSANIRRRIDAADRALVIANQAAEKGERAEGSLTKARVEYKNIFEYYKGSFDPNHPDIIALKKRIDTAEQAMTAGFVQKNATAPLESNSGAVEDLPAQMGADLVAIAGALNILEHRLETAANSSQPGSYLEGVKSDLQFAQDKFEQFQKNYTGSFEPGHVAYQQVQLRLESGQDAVARLKGEAGVAAQAGKNTQNEANDAAAQRIKARYTDVPPTSKVHRANAGRMIWSKQPISLDGQDQIAPEKSFQLSDPIFGRLYLHHSLGNTPVYGSDGEPQENRDFGYEFRLFIDGKEKVDRFNVFSNGNLKGQAGETWTTWQFAPHPLPPDDGFKSEAEAWFRTTKGLSPGTHSVRFELWSVQGQLRSREPISIGEFSLIVQKDERIAAGSQFPREMYSGTDAAQLHEQFKKALAQAKISASEIDKVAIAGDWAYNRYTDSKIEYRKMSAAVLFKDKDNDGVCRFVSYNFISDKSGNTWSTPKFHSFCNGCPEGDAECSR